MVLNRVERGRGHGRISDNVYQELESAIRGLRLAPGALLSETELSIQLGVSRTPLREAISRLVEQRLLTVVSQVGTTVSRIDMADVEEACFIRCALETAAFTRACLTPSRDLGPLKTILERQLQSWHDKDSERFFEADEALHQEIFRLAGYPTVWNLVRGSKTQLDRLRRLLLPTTISSSLVAEEHTGIVRLLERGDIEAGTKLIEAHSFQALDLASVLRASYPEYFTS